jgi:hypothetical protein
MLPVILVSSVHRSSINNQAHGGVYLINLENNKYENLWLAKHEIDLHGRGGERGFRGIAFWKNKTYIALHNGIQIYNQNFDCIGTIETDYLGHIHEICIWEHMLYVVSTQYDSIVVFDLKTNKMINRLTIAYNEKKFSYKINIVPNKKDLLHINNVYVDSRGIFCSGTNFSNLLLINNNMINVFAKSTGDTHNCRPYVDGQIICNDTTNGRISILNYFGKVINFINVKKFALKDMTNVDSSEKIAKQPFARGLAFNEDIIIGGSSPDMISVYDRQTMALIKNIHLSMNATHCIHGLEIYPYKQNIV